MDREACELTTVTVMKQRDIESTLCSEDTFQETHCTCEVYRFVPVYRIQAVIYKTTEMAKYNTGSHAVHVVDKLYDATYSSFTHTQTYSHTHKHTHTGNLQRQTLPSQSELIVL